jgi:hypothetical protein
MVIPAKRSMKWMRHSKLRPVNPCNDVHIVNTTEGRAVALQAEDAGLGLRTVSPLEALRLLEWRRSVNINLKNGGLIMCYV